MLSCVKRVDIGGKHLRLEYDDHEYIFIVFYVFMMSWLLELCTAFSQFIVSYMVELWFFSLKELSFDSKSGSFCTICEAFNVAMLYHLGSLAFGSAIIAMVRGFRDILTL